MEDTKSANTEVRPENGEEPVEEGHREPNFREEEEDAFAENEKTINDRPEYTSWLVRHRCIPIKRLSDLPHLRTKKNILDVIAVDHIIVQRAGRLSIHESVDSLDIIHDLLNVGREGENESDEGKCADGIEPDEDNSTLIEDHIVVLD